MLFPTETIKSVAAAVSELTSNSTELTELTKTSYPLVRALPKAANALICTESLIFTGISATNFCYVKHKPSRLLFATSAVLSATGVIISASALLSGSTVIPTLSFFACGCGRAFNAIGKYTFSMSKTNEENIEKLME